MPTIFGGCCRAAPERCAGDNPGSMMTVNGQGVPQPRVSSRGGYINLMITSTRMTMTKTAIANPRTSPPAGN